MATAKILPNLRSYLAASTNVNAIVGGSTNTSEARIHVNKVPEQDKTQSGRSKSYIWMGRQREEQEQLLNGTYSRLIETEIDLECVYYGDISDADDLSDKVKQRLKDATPGTTLGSDPIQAVVFEDHDDSYVPRNADDEGAHVAAIKITIWHTT